MAKNKVKQYKIDATKPREQKPMLNSNNPFVITHPFIPAQDKPGYTKCKWCAFAPEAHTATTVQ